MKPIYREHLKPELARRIPATFPGFQEMPLRLTKQERKGAVLFPGSQLFACAKPGLTWFLHFIPHQRQERFMAEVGWSVRNRFPIELSSHGPIEAVKDEFLKEEWLVDFGTIYHRHHGRGHLGWDVWTCSASTRDPNFMQIFMAEDALPVTTEGALSRVSSAIDRCISDLTEVALPYLERR